MHVIDSSEIHPVRFEEDSQRLNRGAGVKGSRFYLINGGFVPQTIQYGDTLERPTTRKMPEIQLPVASATPASR